MIMTRMQPPRPHVRAFPKAPFGASGPRHWHRARPDPQGMEGRPKGRGGPGETQGAPQAGTEAGRQRGEEPRRVRGKVRLARKSGHNSGASEIKAAAPRRAFESPQLPISCIRKCANFPHLRTQVRVRFKLARLLRARSRSGQVRLCYSRAPTSSLRKPRTELLPFTFLQ